MPDSDAVSRYLDIDAGPISGPASTTKEVFPFHIHDLFPRRKFCKKHLVWRGDTLVCSKCGEPAGFRWLRDDRVQIYLYPAFRSETTNILLRKDTRTIKDRDDYLGKIDFKEFDDFIADIRERSKITPTIEYFEINEGEDT